MTTTTADGWSWSAAKSIDAPACCAKEPPPSAGRVSEPLPAVDPDLF
jgi:hypothetical protein